MVRSLRCFNGITFITLLSDKHVNNILITICHFFLSMYAKLQRSVQEELVAKILHGSRKPELLDISDSEEPAINHAPVTMTKTTTPENCSMAKHISTITSQSQTTPLVNHSSHTNTTSHAYSPTQTTPLLNHSPRTDTTSHAYSPTQTTLLLKHIPRTDTTSHAYSPTQTTPLLNHIPRTNTTSHAYLPTQTTPLLNHSPRTNTTSHAYSPTQTTPLVNHSSHTNTITSHTYPPTHNTSAFNRSTSKHTNTSHKRTPLTDYNSQTTLRNSFITPPQVLNLDTYPTPLSCEMSPVKSFTKLLADDDCENVPLTHSPSLESFTSHFTQEFEWLKAEVDGLRNEVKSLRRTVRELKVIQC